MRSRYFPFALLSVACLACAKEPEPIDYSHAADFAYTGVLQVNEPVTFRSVSADAQSYEWDFGDDTGTSTGQQVVHTFIKSGLFTVKLLAVTAGGVKTSTQQVTITVAYNHAADFTYYGTLNFNEPIRFSSTSSLAQDHRWDFGDGTAPVPGSYPVHAFTRGGTFPVTLTVTTPIGPITSTKQLTISQVDTLAPYFAAVVGNYRLTRQYSTSNYGVVTTCDIPVTAVRSGNRLVLQYAGGNNSNELALASLSYKPGYYSFGISDYRTRSEAKFKIGTDSIFLNSYSSGLGGSTETWTWGKRR